MQIHRLLGRSISLFGIPRFSVARAVPFSRDIAPHKTRYSNQESQNSYGIKMFCTVFLRTSQSWFYCDATNPTISLTWEAASYFCAHQHAQALLTPARRHVRQRSPVIDWSAGNESDQRVIQLASTKGGSAVLRARRLQSGQPPAP